MKRTATILSAAASFVIAWAAVAEAQNAGPKLTPLPDPSVPAQRQAVQPQKQPVPAQNPAPAQSATVVTPELLIGHWDINVDSYLDTRLQLKGKVCEDPAKIECVRNTLKANGLYFSFDFYCDGCGTVSKGYCGKCEVKSGSWRVKCIDGPRMSVELRSRHGWTRRRLEVAVCDDLHIRVLAPAEIAGIYERAPVAVTEVTTEKKANAPKPADVPPAPDDVAP
ncbi:MAG: hypothetical protein WD648_03410 [Planctomycetaceae bacterium]